MELWKGLHLSESRVEANYTPKALRFTITYLRDTRRGFPDTVLKIGLVRVLTPAKSSYEIRAPVNYNHHCYGPMRYRVALANPSNISAVKVLASIGEAEPLGFGRIPLDSLRLRVILRTRLREMRAIPTFRLEQGYLL